MLVHEVPSLVNYTVCSFGRFLLLVERRHAWYWQRGNAAKGAIDENCDFQS